MFYLSRSISSNETKNEYKVLCYRKSQMTLRFNPHFAVIPEFFGDIIETSYEQLLTEIRDDLKQGSVSVFGNTMKERRLTCYYSLGGGEFRYSGRTLTGTMPAVGSVVHTLLSLMNTDAYHEVMQEEYPEIAEYFCDEHSPNACFLNWYRPTSETDKPDGIGWHADDEKSHASQVIWSLSICEDGGEMRFRFRRKGQTSGFDHEFQMDNRLMLVMLPGCQQAYKHCVGMMATKLDGGKVTGGRINLTFRRIK
jgi:alkylated DNA repair dioxygenase AlkB